MRFKNKHCDVSFDIYLFVYLCTHYGVIVAFNEEHILGTMFIKIAYLKQNY